MPLSMVTDAALETFQRNKEEPPEDIMGGLALK